MLGGGGKTRWPFTGSEFNWDDNRRIPAAPLGIGRSEKGLGCITLDQVGVKGGMSRAAINCFKRPGG